MLGHHRRGLKVTSGASRREARVRTRRGRRLLVLEGLEDRLLLSGNPTIYTVNSTGNGASGSGDSGTLPYVIGQANANTNTAGSEIQFDPTVFASPQTITLSSTLVLSETAGPEVIDGPGASRVTVSGNNAVEVFSVASGVTATLTRLSISSGLASEGGGLSIDGGEVSLTNAVVTNNQAAGAAGTAGPGAQSGPGGAGGDGGNGLGGGIYLAGGSLILNNDIISGNVARGGAGESGRSGVPGPPGSQGGAGGPGGIGGMGAGGGVYVASGSLALSGDTFGRNQAIGGNGGNGGRGGLGASSDSFPYLTVGAGGAGGVGGAGNSGAGGAIYLAQGTVTLASTALSENVAVGGDGGNGGRGGTGGAGGVRFAPGPGAVGGQGGLGGNAGAGYGGAIYSLNGTVSLSQATVDANSVRGGRAGLGGTGGAGGAGTYGRSGMTGFSGSPGRPGGTGRPGGVGAPEARAAVGVSEGRVVAAVCFSRRDSSRYPVRLSLLTMRSGVKEAVAASAAPEAMAASVVEAASAESECSPEVGIVSPPAGPRAAPVAAGESAELADRARKVV